MEKKIICNWFCIDKNSSYFLKYSAGSLNNGSWYDNLLHSQKCVNRFWFPKILTTDNAQLTRGLLHSISNQLT